MLCMHEMARHFSSSSQFTKRMRRPLDFMTLFRLLEIKRDIAAIKIVIHNWVRIVWNHHIRFTIFIHRWVHSVSHGNFLHANAFDANEEYLTAICYRSFDKRSQYHSYKQNPLKTLIFDSVYSFHFVVFIFKSFDDTFITKIYHSFFVVSQFKLSRHFWLAPLTISIPSNIKLIYIGCVSSANYPL